MRRIVLPFALMMVMAACASTGTSNRGSADELTRSDIDGANQATVLDLIRSMRPQWLRIRGPNSFMSENPIQVYVDGMRYGTIEDLQGLPTLSIERIRFLDGTEAQSKWGLNHTNGAIEVTTRRG